MQTHLEINNWTGRRWFIGDIHGYLNTFRTLVEQKIKLQKEDTLILLGDLIDRGPFSKQLLDYLINLKDKGYHVILIRGNHDDMLYNARQEAEAAKGKGFLFFKPASPVKDLWLPVGGAETLKSFETKNLLDIPKPYFELIESMVYYLKMPDLYAVHAGFDFNSDSPFTDYEAMMWIREYKVNTQITEGRKVIHGHTPLDLDLISDLIKHPEKEDFIPLDNGIMTTAPNKGNLLGYCPDTNELIVQKRVEEI